MGRGRSGSGSPGRSRSRSRDRGGSPSRSQSHRSDSRDGEGKPKQRRPDDYGVDTLKITDDDAAFILGKGGKTKEKIARVSAAEIELFERDLILEIRGSRLQRRRAKKYAEGVMAQRTGPVAVRDDYDDDDLTMLVVPQEAVGFVTGRAGNFLRSIEEEWNTLMFFCEVDGSSGRRNKSYEKLAIFGSIRGRRGAELKVLSAVETKVPGYYSSIKDEVLDRDRGKDETGGWGTDTTTFQDDELSYALGKQGGTRKKLEKSSGAIVQYVGHVALFSGTKQERRRAKEYMKWLFEQLEGPVYVDNWQDRDDVTVVDVPSDCIGYVTGNRRAALGAMEEEWGTLMFFMTRPGDKGKGRGFGEQLAIFGSRRGRRGAELKVMSFVEEKAPGHFTRGIRDKVSDSGAFDTDRMIFKDDELSYALGKGGTTRKKLAHPGAAFARARQAAKKTKLRVGSDGGAGLDMEATRWGYLVEEVEDDPGQPDLKAGVLIIAIGGQALHGLEDEDVMNWRFGRSFGAGVELTFLPAEHAGAVLAAEKAGGDAVVEEQEKVPSGPTKRLTQTRRKVELPMKLEAWTVAAHREPPRLLALLDNRLHLADLAEDRPLLKDVLSGVVRAPHKRPATRLAVLDGSGGDLLLAGIAKAVLIWRVPALLLPLVGPKPPQPELLAAVSMPGRCTFTSGSLGLSLGSDALGWLAAEISGAGEPGGNLDIWQWYNARRKPLPPLPTALRGRSSRPTSGDADEGDVVAQTLTACGTVVEAVAKALKRGAARAPLPAAAQGKDQVSSLRTWCSKLPDEDGEALYAAVNEAEKAMAEGVRELRRWLRTDGGKAVNILVAARADDARAVSKWADQCRRTILWPLQAAFEAEASEHDEDEDQVPPGGLRFPLLARPQGGAAGTPAPAAEAQPAATTAPAPAEASGAQLSARERAAAAAAARAAQTAG